MTARARPLSHRLLLAAVALALLALSGCGDQIRLRPVFGGPGGAYGPVPRVNEGWGGGAGSRA